VLSLPFFRRSFPAARGTQDFFGVNYYLSDYVVFSLFNPKQLFTRRFFAPDADLSDTGWIANEPQGMFEALKWGRQFKLPMIVTENGVEDADDHLRPRYLLQHLHQVWRAVNFN
jgi:beta-glucosidase